MNQQRLYYLDALRAFAMLLGIVLHAGMPLYPWRSWSGDESAQALAIDILMGSIHSFRMPLFFLLSGFFALMLLNRRGITGFVRHRLRRVALPFAVGYPVILMSMIGAYIAGFIAIVIGDPDLGKELEAKMEDGEESGGFDLMHLWFLWYLSLFVGTFALIMKFLQSIRIPEALQFTLRKVLMLTIPLLLLIPYLFMPRDGTPEVDTYSLLNWRMFTYYFGYFLLGALLFGQNTKSGQPLIEWIGNKWKFLLSVALTLLMFSFALTDFTKSSVWWFVYCVVHISACWCFCFGFIGLFNRYFSEGKYWIRYWSDASFFMYLMHLPVLVFMQAIVIPIPVPLIAKFLLQCLLAVGMLYVMYRFAVRYTWIGRLLNGKRTRDEDIVLKEALDN